uniref:Uncharacterized protein n=1 Tax=Panagrolaimus sp. JU765 TaxID=591449 RepID=A0AC34RPS4_9BILA
MTTKKYVFGSPCGSPARFDEKKIIVNDGELTKKPVKSQPKTSVRCFVTNDLIEIANCLFDLNNEELTERMTDEKLLRTLIFLYENMKVFDFVCKIEKTTSSDGFYSKSTAISKIDMGYLCILILKNVQDTNADKVRGKVEKLFNGDPSQFKDNVKFCLMMNYDIIPVTNATNLSEIFREVYLGNFKPIPVSVTMHEKSNN